MSNKVAVLVDENMNLVGLQEATKVRVYEHIENDINASWEVTDEFNIEINRDIASVDIKETINALIQSIKMCKVILGDEITGIPYYLLTKAGYEVCEAKKLTEEVLNQIEEDYYTGIELNDGQSSNRLTNESKEDGIEIESVELTHTIKNISKYPVPIDAAGNFSVNIIEVQKAYPEISTKKILVPFFTDTLFQTLEIKCTHIMPWIEGYILQRDWDIKITREPGVYTILVSHKICA